MTELTAEKRGTPNPSTADDPGNPMEDRILAAAERIAARQNIFENGDTALRRHQQPACANFCNYFLDMATGPTASPLSAYCRIVLPPRTGKTVVAGQILCLAGLCATFVVPSKTLIKQTEAEFTNLLQGMPIGIYYSEKKQPVANGINITTYATLQSHFTKGILPQEIRQSAIVFFDEAHHAMTPLRLDTIARAFAPQTIRVALTATPDYNKDKRLGRFLPGLVLGETPLRKRDRLLSAFKNGQIDTLIQVGVLIEGWDAPHCKLLLDIAHCASNADLKSNLRAFHKFS